ncbi:MAG: hypothetical protein ACI4MS_03260 [Candidatus Coproplasma sp.]
MKIIKGPKFKPITCPVCGCVYEYEIGDIITTISARYNSSRINTRMEIACPICGAENELQLQKEEGEQ